MKTRILTLALAALLSTAAPAFAASGAGYLESHLTASGGIAEQGQPPTVGITEWAVMALRAAGVNPAALHRAGGRTPTHYLASHAAGWSDAFQIEKGILGAVALHADPHSFGGRNLVQALRNRVHPSSGRIGNFANSTYWGALAFAGAREHLPTHTVHWIESRQQADGGFSYLSTTPAGADSNDTAAAVMALRAAGVPCSNHHLGRAYAYMKTAQGPGHGYALLPGGSADSQSTSWVVQARAACSLKNTGARAWLAARRSSNGSYFYSPGNHQTPVFVTSQVLPATNGRHYPVR
jgi:iron complex transport system substrate-binding protein